MTKEIDPLEVINFFIKELSNDNVHHRIYAANNISVIAASIGPEHCRKELVEFLMCADEFDPDVQFCLAACLGSLVKYVGGPEYAHVLFPPLQILAAANEPVIREKAIESMVSVSELIPPKDADDILMEAFNGLTNINFFTAKSSACYFAIKIYQKVNDDNEKVLRNVYKEFIKNETPMVRRFALKNFPAFCEILPISIILNEFFNDILVPVTNDDEDSVRLLLPASLSIISNKLDENNKNMLIIPLLRTIIKDGSWRVRAALADELPKIAESFSTESVMNDICPLLFKLMRDPETETKTSAVKAVSKILHFLKGNEEFISENFIPEFANLVKDCGSQVRKEISLRLMELASNINSQNINNLIVPLFIQILRENDNEANVALLSSLLLYADKVDLLGMIPGILPTILEIASETHWRVKYMVIKLIPSFAKVLELNNFNKKLFHLVEMWLSDSIFSVREQMVKQLGPLVQLFGVDWCIEMIVPLILGFQNHCNYLIRQVTLISVAELHDYLPMSVLVQYFLPTVLEMSNDMVPNVRFMVAKTLSFFAGIEDKNINQKIQECLKNLSNDKDIDVKYFACVTLNKFQN